MKSKKINKLRFEDKENTELLLGFAIFLETLSIKSAEKMANEFQYILDEEFCGECDSPKDNCDCHPSTREYDYDREYDEWKDSQFDKLTENED